MYSNGIFIRLVTLSYSRMVSISQPSVHPPRPIGFRPPFSLSLHSGKLSRVSLLQGVEVNCDSKIVQFISFVRRSWHGLLKHGPQDNEKSRILCVGTRHSKSRGQSHLLLGDPEEREGGDQGGDIYYGKSFQFITSEKRKEEALSRRILYIRLDGV